MEIKRLLIAISIVVGVGLCSCSDNNVKDTRVVVISQEKMTDMLFDVQVLEAYLTNKRSAGENVNGLREILFDQLFEYYEVTEEIFLSNLEYYNSDVKVMEKMMTAVSKRIDSEKKVIESRSANNK